MPNLSEAWDECEQVVRANSSQLSYENIKKNPNFGDCFDEQADARIAGIKKIEEFESWLEKIQVVEKKRLTWLQKTFIRHFRNQNIVNIIGKDTYDQASNFFLDYCNIKHQRLGTAIDANRRAGKTYAVTTAQTALGLTAVGNRTVILAPVFRTSGVLLGEIRQQLEKLDMSFDTCNKIEIAITVEGDKRIWRSYSGSVKAGKGMEATNIVLEEGARIPPETTLEVAIPLLNVANVPLMYISTPLGKGNWYNTWLETKWKGEPIFTRKKYPLVCEKCHEAKRVADCMHKAYITPPWKSHQRQAMVKKLMECAPEIYATEALGVVPDDESNCFSREDLEVLVCDDGIVPETEVFRPMLFISVDPSETGMSQTAIVSFMLTRTGKFVIVSIDAERMTGLVSDTQARMIQDHIDRLQNECHINLASMKIVSIVENNGHGTVCELIQTNLERALKKHKAKIEHTNWMYGNSQRSKDSTVGIWSDNTIKAEYIENLRDVFATKSIYFSNLFTTAYDKKETVSDTEKSRDMAIVSMKYHLHDQLVAYRAYANDDKLKQNPFAMPKFTYSGKTWTTQDDCATALAFGIYFATMKIKSRVYRS